MAIERENYCFINFDIAMKSEINVRGSLKCDLCDLYFLLQ